MTHGELIRKLRKERELTQDQLARGITSRTTLSSFENNHSRVSSEILFAYIERMNITVQEYLFYFNDSTPTEKELSTRYFYKNIVQSRDFEIKNRILDYQLKYKDSHDFFFCCLSIELKLFLNHKHINPVFDVEEDTQIIKDYLEKVQQWGHFEMSIFSNCLYIFKSDYIRGTFSTLLNKTKILSTIDTYQNDIAIFLNNCIILSFERNQLKNARFYVGQLLKISSNTPRRAYDRMMYDFYIELLKDITIGRSHVFESIKRFNDLGFTEHSKELRKFRDQIILKANHISA